MIDKACANVLAAGLRTADIKGDAAATVSTVQMGDAIVAELQKIK
jgi:3-isopropylmalate dehydrogenase